MARIFITGSTDGLGRAAARALVDDGHQVVLHARSRERASAVDDLASRSEGVVVGDVTALAFAVAPRWSDVLSNAVDPGWVATKMGGPGAPDDFEKGYLTQSW